LNTGTPTTSALAILTGETVIAPMTTEVDPNTSPLPIDVGETSNTNTREADPNPSPDPILDGVIDTTPIVRTVAPKASPDTISDGETVCPPGLPTDTVADPNTSLDVIEVGDTETDPKARVALPNTSSDPIPVTVIV